MLNCGPNNRFLKPVDPLKPIILQAVLEFIRNYPSFAGEASRAQGNVCFKHLKSTDIPFKWRRKQEVFVMYRVKPCIPLKRIYSDLLYLRLEVVHKFVVLQFEFACARFT